MSEQTELYTKMQGFKLTEGVKAGYDYFLLDTIKGIQYYTPNDETWGAITGYSRETIACLVEFSVQANILSTLCFIGKVKPIRG